LFGRGDRRQSFGSGLHPGDPGGILRRTDQYEIIVHDVIAGNAVAALDERVFPGASMNEDDVGVSILTERNCLPGSECHHVDAGVEARFEIRQDRLEQSRVIRAGRRRQP